MPSAPSSSTIGNFAGSVIGYHAVAPAPGQGEIAADRLEAATRAVMAEIADYVAEMGVDARLPALASEVSADTLFIPAAPIRAVLRIETPTEVALADGAGASQL